MTVYDVRMCVFLFISKEPFKNDVSTYSALHERLVDL